MYIAVLAAKAGIPPPPIFNLTVASAIPYFTGIIASADFKFETIRGDSIMADKFAFRGIVFAAFIVLLPLLAFNCATTTQSGDDVKIGRAHV